MSDWDPRANEIFLAAVELADADQRRALLDKLCGGDTELRAQVDSLLSASNDAGDFLEQPVVELAPTIVSDEINLDFLARSESPDSLGRLGDYEVSAVIGRGGMGIVLEGQDAQLNRVVAIKVLAPEMAGNTTARRRFLREAQAAAAVTHQQVVTIHAVHNDEVPYLVMERIAGQSLQEKIEAEGTLSLKEILRIGTQIASGLEAAHAQGLIHRDIKPSNILLENGVERVRITDFGLARAVDDVSITGTGQVAGSPQYMSPEQAQGHTVDGRSDLFSLGCVLYAMCTGRSPFRAETTVAALRRVCDEKPRPIREVNPEVPAWLIETIDRLLEKDPAGRLQTAGELADRLSSYLAHVQDPDSTPRPAASLPSVRSKQRRNFGRIMGVVVVVVAIAGIYLTESARITHLFDFSEPAVTSDEATEQTPSVPQTPGSVPFVGPNGEIDLLRLIDSERDSVVGDWRLSGAVLVSPSTGNWDRLDIPYVPPQEYDIEITAERKAGNDLLSVSLISGRRQFFVAFDRFGGTICGLGLIDGKEDFANETTVEQPIFADGRPHKLVCRIRRNGVKVTVDGDPLIDWRGSLDRLSIPDAGRTDGLGLTTLNSTYHVYDVVLKPVREISDSPPVLTEVRTFKGHGGSVKQVAVSRDGTRALSCSGVQGDRSVRLWEVATGREIRTFDTSGKQILAVRFSKDDRRAVGAGFGGDIYIWNVATGDLFTTLSTDKEVVTDLDVTPDDRFLLCTTHKRAYPSAKPVSDLSSAQLWDLDAENVVWQFDHSGWLETCRFLRDEERVVVAGRQTGCAVHLLDRATGDELRKFNLGNVTDHQIEELAVSHDGRLIATASELGYVCLWDAGAGEEPVKYRSNMGNLRSVAFSRDDRQLLCAGGEGESGSVQLLETPGLEIVAAVEHPGGLAWDVAYTPDGRHALSAGGWSHEGPGDYALRLWRLPDPGDNADRVTAVIDASEALRYPTSHKGPVLSIAVSPNGRLIATGSSDNTVQLFDRDRRSAVHRLTAETAYDLKFTPDSSQLLSAGEDGTVRLWDVETGGEVRRFTGHDSWVVSVDLSVDDRTVLTSSHDGTIRLWDLNSTDQLHRIDVGVGTTTQAFSVRFDAGGDRFVSAHADGTVTLWDTSTREIVKSIPAHEGMAYYAEISPDGRTLLTTGSDGVACLWDVDSRRRLHTLPHEEEVTEGEFLEDGRFVVTSSRDKTVCVWNVQTGRQITRATTLTHCNSAIALLPDSGQLILAGGLLRAYSANGKMVWVGDGDYDIRLWRLPDLPRTGKFPANSGSMPQMEQLQTTHTGPVFSLAVSPDGRLIASGSSDETIHLYDRQARATQHVLDGHFALGLRFVSEGRQILSAGDDGTLRLWDTAAGEEVLRYEGHRGWVLSVDVSQDGQKVLSGGEDGTIRRWDLESGNQLDEIDVDVEGETQAIFSVRYSTDGNRIVSSHHDGTVTVWDAATLDEIKTISAHSGKAYTARLSPTGHMLVTSGNDDVGCLWDAGSGRRRQTFPHADNVTSAEFVADGRYVVTGSGDKTLRIWSTRTGQEVAHAIAPTHCTTAVALLPDGYLVSAGGLENARTEGGAPVWDGDGDYDLHVWRLPETVRAAVRAGVDQSPSLDEQIAALTDQIEQSPKDASLRITRAHQFVRQSRWRDAADDLEVAGEAVYEDPGNAFLYAILLVFLNEHELHQQHCAKLLVHSGETNDVWTANCVAKSCLLRPGVVDLDRLPMHLLSDDYGFASGQPSWVLPEARALFACRAGDFETARQQVHETIDDPSYRDDPLYAPRALSILAMAAHGSGETDLAGNLFEQATRRLEQIELAPDDMRAFGWVYAEVLRREAAGVLEDIRSPEDGSD